MLDRQKEVLADLEKQVQAFESSDVVLENAVLKEKLTKLEAENEASKFKAAFLKNENANLKNALYNHTYNEKIKFIDRSKAKLGIYFGQAVGDPMNQLTQLENSIKARIYRMTFALRQNNVDTINPLFQKVIAFEEEIRQTIVTAREHIASQAAFSDEENAAFDKLRDEQITKEQIVAVAKKNNWERFVGLNLINTLGILLIIIGAIAAGQFAFVRVTDPMRAAAIFGLGTAMVIAGEIMNRRKANVFSLGVTAGGLAVLYVALVVSHFVLEVIGMFPALGICVVITALAFVLSTRYRSQTLLTIAFVGGYLPIFSISPDPAMIYGAMIYFIMLNLLDLVVSFKMKWTVSSFVGLGFNIISTTVIIWTAPDTTLIEQWILLVFVLFSFGIYTATPLISTYCTKIKFAVSDVVLMALNTFFSCVTAYIIFAVFGWYDFTGLLALIYAVIYFGLAILLWRKFENANTMRDLFFITGFTFAVLIVPFQFDWMWLSLGWLIQGVGVLVYGILKNNRRFSISGWVVFGLCLAVFALMDLQNHWWVRYDDLFWLKYWAISLGSLAILGAFVYKKYTVVKNVGVQIFKYATMINLWFLGMDNILRLNARTYHILIGANFNNDYFMNMFLFLMALVLGFSLPRIKCLADSGTRIIGILFYIFGIGGIVISHGVARPILSEMYAVSTSVAVFGSIAIIVMGLLSMSALYDLMRRIVVMAKGGMAYLPVIVSGYFVVILTQILIVQYGMRFDSMWISFIYVVTALAWIIWGFARRYMLLRRFGLGLTLASVAKLFIIDLAGLTQGHRILSYFTLGVLLLGISFVYQFFNKRLEIKIQEDSSEAKDSETEDISPPTTS
ncbi:MAG: DUF2339 domain-containing protein [Defluviitaleaceae bacterium]|nr:DUF2339 domain-containing protein [Defluviitaleaceae bacterium]